MAVNQNVTQIPTQQAVLDTTSLLYAVTGGTTDTGLPVSVLLNNTTLTGSPTVPGYLTSALAASTYLTQANAASTYATITNLNLKAPIVSPTFTGTVVIPTVTLSGGTINSTSVGATTPSTGAFTTLSASSTVSGTGFSTYLASPPAIGGTVAAAGSFTTIGASGLISPTSTVGIKGTTTNDSTAAGSVGEYVTSSASGVSLTSTVIANITSISLTAGDWDVSGAINFVPAASTTPTFFASSTNSTSVTNGPLGSVVFQNAPFPAGQTQTLIAPTTRYSLASTTTIFLVAQASFSVSTLTANGLIRARRVR